jgi:predicted negative regulator of RcsB-dependent stress response
VDEYLSEKEQIEQIKQWWRENGWYLIGGAALAAIGYFGFNQYQAWQDRVAEEASSLYQELNLALEDDDRAGAESLLATLVSDYADSPYLDQARFLLAEANLIRDTDRAIDELAAVVADSEDSILVNIARLRLARVLAWDAQHERALAVLSTPEPGEFEARFSEVRGDIHAATGDSEAAISAYTDALLASGNGSVNREFLQLKLNDLIQALDTGIGASTEDAPVSAAETAAETADMPADETGEPAAAVGDEAGEAG